MEGEFLAIFFFVIFKERKKFKWNRKKEKNESCDL